MLLTLFLSLILVLGRGFVVPGCGKRWPRAGLVALQHAAPSVDLADILSASDLKQVESRLVYLKSVFPGIDDEELRQIVRTSPMLLFVDKNRLEGSVRKLAVAVGYVNASYILTQRAPGLELLLSISNSSFDFEDSLKSVVEVVGSAYNVTHLIRRVPQLLVPKFLSEFRQVVESLRRGSGCTKNEAIGAVEAYPGLLLFGPTLATKLDRLESSLTQCGIMEPRPSGEAEADDQRLAILKRVVLAVPRVLAQNSTRRFAALRELYPSWDLAKVVRYNPYVLTQNLDVLHAQYTSLQQELGGLYNVDDIVNSMPTTLRVPSAGLKAKASKMAAIFPSSLASPGGAGGRFVVEKVPELLFSMGVDKLTSQVRKIEAAFMDSDPGAAAAVAEADLDTDTDTDADTDTDTDTGTDTDTDTNNQFISSGPSGTIKAAPAVKLDLSRIIAANSNLFLRRFPYMVQLVRAWVSEFEDSAVAYTVLNAVPAVLTKRPSGLRPSIKALYRVVAEARTAQESLQLFNEGGSKGGGVAAGFSAPATAIAQGAICCSLQKLLIEAPQVIRQSPEQLRGRISDLQALFASPLADANGGSALSSVVGPLILANARILTEPVERLALRLVILDRLQTLKRGPETTTAVPAAPSLWALDSNVLLAAPKTLSAPLAVLLRPFFVESFFETAAQRIYLKDMSCREQWDVTATLISKNTDEFLRMVGDQCATDSLSLSESYCAFLQQVSGDLINDEAGGGAGVEVGDGDEGTLRVGGGEAANMERRVCGLLNDLAKSAGKGSVGAELLIKLGGLVIDPRKEQQTLQEVLSLVVANSKA